MNRLLSTLFARKATVRTPRRPSRLDIESLGDRTLLAGGITASLDMADHILRVTGSDQADAIRVINEAGQVRVDGINITVRDSAGEHPAASVATSAISYARAEGLGGDDRIEMVQKNSPAFVLEAFGGAGKDTLVGGSAADRLFGGSEIDQLIGGAGADQLDGGGQQDVLIQGTFIDASALIETYFLVDGAPHDQRTPFVGDLAPGGHYVYTYGGVAWFNVNADGTFGYEPALEGVLTGQGTNALAVRGVSIRIDASALPAMSMVVDYATQAPQAALDVRVMPGTHFVYTQGVMTWFKVGADGKVSYDPALEGPVTGQGTNTLTLRGSEVRVDATALLRTTLNLDYLTYDPSAPVTTRLMPGDHFAYTQGSMFRYKVDTAGRVSYDPALEGIATGQGTNTLTLRGAAVRIDASALPSNFLSVDYVSQTPQSAVDARLMPGDHFAYTQGVVMWFKVGTDGKISYDPALEGVLTGQGTNSLTLRGRPVIVNPQALSDTALSLDYVSISSADSFQVSLLPGRHFIYTNTGRVLYFTVGVNGITDRDPALAGVVTDPATATLEPGGVLRIRGTEAADRIRVVQLGELLWIDGMSIAVPGGTGTTSQPLLSASDVSVVIVDAGGGGDTVTFDSMGVTGRRVPIKVVGGDGDDTLTGGDGDDTLIGGNGNDAIDGRVGDDLLIGAHDGWGGEVNGSSDTIWGGTGNDVMFGGDGQDTEYGGTGDDRLAGDAGDDVLNGDAGNDKLEGGWDSDVLNGGENNDTLVGGEGIDLLHGGMGNDTLWGARERNSYEFQDADNYLWGDQGDDNLYGGNGSDLMDGGANNDGLFGGLGFNALRGGSGADRFITWAAARDTVADAEPADATIHFVDSPAMTNVTPPSGWPNTKSYDFLAGAWTAAEIANADQAFGNMHALTRNTRLLELSNGGRYTFIRRGQQTSGDYNFGGQNDGAGNIVIGQTREATLDTNAMLQAIYHEIGHTWFAPGVNSNYQAFLDLSGWRQAAESPGSVWNASDGVGDDWWYVNTAQFARPYGRLSPAEDWCTTWETYFMNRYHGSTLGGNLVRDKVVMVERLLGDVTS